MSSRHQQLYFQLPEIKISDIEFWFNSVELILSSGTAGTYCDDHKYEYVKEYLESIRYGSFLKGMPKLTKGNKFEGLRNHVVEDIKDKFALSCILDGVSFFRCIDLKPSAFLYVVIRTYSCKHAVPASVTRTFLLARLPRHIQKIMLAALLLDPQPLDEKTPEQVAAVADGISAYIKYHTHQQTQKSKIMLPKFVASDPELWFYSLDEAFTANGVTDDLHKFEYTISALPEELSTAALFLTELPNQTTQNKYANLKERILKTYALIQEDKTYNFIFRNMTGLRPKSLLQFMNNLATKTSRDVPQLLIRTFWIMMLPIQTQAVLFQLLVTSLEPLQDLDMNTMALVAESRWRDIESPETMTLLPMNISAPELDKKAVDPVVFLSDLCSATSLQQKISLGMKYCDFMYKSYYRNNPKESIQDCTVFKPRRNMVTEEQHYYFEGCTCKYHERYGEAARHCTQVKDEE